MILFFLAVLPIITSFPLNKNDDRIIFPDDDVDDGVADLKFDQVRLLADPKILKSDNTTSEFLTDGSELQQLENGKFFQGDILLLPDQEEFLNANLTDDDFPTRTGLISESYRWPKNRNGKVIVPYVLSDEYCK